jgi:hypothetical protein
LLEDYRFCDWLIQFIIENVPLTLSLCKSNVVSPSESTFVYDDSEQVVSHLFTKVDARLPAILGEVEDHGKLCFGCDLAHGRKLKPLDVKDLHLGPFRDICLYPSLRPLLALLTLVSFSLVFRLSQRVFF